MASYLNRAPLLTALLAAALITGAAVAAVHSPATMQTVLPDQIKWGAGPPSLPPGVQMVVLQGDPGKPGPFTLRAKMPAGYKIPAHWHPTDENLTVISGVFHIGMGGKLDTSMAKALPAGGFMSMPARTNHYAWVTQETILQVHGMGPFEITYINPADDPRKR
jgi:hypothetical protein